MGRRGKGQRSRRTHMHTDARTPMVVPTAIKQVPFLPEAKRVNLASTGERCFHRQLSINVSCITYRKNSRRFCCQPCKNWTNLQSLSNRTCKRTRRLISRQTDRKAAIQRPPTWLLRQVIVGSIDFNAAIEINMGRSDEIFDLTYLASVLTNTCRVEQFARRMRSSVCQASASAVEASLSLRRRAGSKFWRACGDSQSALRSARKDRLRNAGRDITHCKASGLNQGPFMRFCKNQATNL